MQRAIALRENAVIASCIAAQVNELEVEVSRTPVFGPRSFLCSSSGYSLRYASGKITIWYASSSGL